LGPSNWDFVNVQDSTLTSHGYKPIRQAVSQDDHRLVSARLLRPQNRSRTGRISSDSMVSFGMPSFWLNGNYLGRNLSGYSEFGFDVSDYLRYGQKNQIGRARRCQQRRRLVL